MILSIKRLLSGLTLLTLPFLMVAQSDKSCGTEVDDRTIEFIRTRLADAPSSFRSRTEQTEVRMGITAHVIRRSDGTGGLTENQLEAALDIVNNFYSNSNIEFFFFGDVNFIDDDQFFDYDSDQEDAVASSRDIPNTINIYFANSLTAGGSALCGYAYFPGNADRIFMDNSCTMNGTTLSHEIGHYLTLYHTHGKTNNGTTDELVDGSNCESAGDDICDTAADPNLSGKVNGSCQYSSNERDGNGDLFQPNTENIMSYAPQSCRRLFTNGQYERAFEGAVNFRDYITQKAYIADFQFPQRVVCVNEEVTFSNNSFGNYESIEWEFIGGTTTNSTSSEASTSYSAPGIYDVKLTVFGEDGGTDERIIERAVQVVDYSDITTAALDFDFENSDINQFETLSPEDSYTFSIESIGKESDGSLSMQFFDYDVNQKTDLLLFDPLANPGNMDYVVSFDYAFTYFATSDGAQESSDNVRLLTKSCDQIIEIWNVNGKENATAEPSNTSFSPTSSEWVHVELYVPISNSADYVQLLLETTNSNGNNFYIDNLKVEYAQSIIIRNVEVTPEECAGDENGEIIIEASFNSNAVEYSIDDINYSSSGTFSNLSSGNYMINIRSGDESILQLVSVDLISQRPAKPVIVFSNNELRLLASVATIEWYYDDVLVDDTNSTSLTSLGPGSYYVVVKNEVGCENISDPFVVLGEEDDANLVIYPNPASNFITIRDSELHKINEIILHDMQGKSNRLNVNLDGRISVDEFSKGMYLLELRYDDNVIIKKVLLN